MKWFVDWFTRTYLLNLATQGGAIATILFLLGLSDEAEAFLQARRPVVIAVLIVHWLLYLVNAIGNIDRDRLELFRRENLDEGEVNDTKLVL